MAKVYHSNAVAPEPAATSTSGGSVSAAAAEEQQTAVMTVWRKSLLFNCDSFTVFDARGDLAFRVDCYGSGRRAEVVLMDAAGTPLLTVCRKRLVSLAEHWVIYDGDGEHSASLLSVRRHVSLRASKQLARVTPLGSGAGAAEAYVVEGSYGRRSCAIRDARGEAVAEVATTCSGSSRTPASARRSPWASSSPTTRCSAAAAAAANRAPPRLARRRRRRRLCCPTWHGALRWTAPSPKTSSKPAQGQKTNGLDSKGMPNTRFQSSGTNSGLS
ncbi:hypothetical protein ACP4OV_008477 [Aristida adscensionis]